MANQVLNTRIKLRCDTYANWAEKDPVLLSGELAAVVLSQNGDGDNLNDTVDTILFKIGDGSHKFSELGWTSSLAADVYEWAKASVKPQYNYTEINNTPIIEADLSSLTEVATNRIYCHTGSNSDAFTQGHLYNYMNSSWIDLLDTNTTLKTLIGDHSIEELGDAAWMDETDILNVVTAKYTPEVTTESMKKAISDALEALEFNRYYTGTEAPASDFGNDGDIYLQQ